MYLLDAALHLQHICYITLSIACDNTLSVRASRMWFYTAWHVPTSPHFLHPDSLDPINTAFVDRLNFQHAQANWSWSLSNDRQGWKSAFQKSIPASPPSRTYWQLSLWMQYHINIFRFLSLVSIAEAKSC